MKRGFMLLEVVIAVGILGVGMAVIGMQVHNGVRVSRRSERAMRALLLAESKLAELDSGLLIPDEEETEEEFGPLFPDYAWRLRIEPATNHPELNLLTLDILHQVRLDVDEEFDFDEALVVHRLYTLRTTPQAVDLTRDFGLDDEDADALEEQLAGVTEEGIDPRNLDPGLFADLDMDQLLEVAPALLEAFGLSIDSLISMLPEELRQALEDAEAEMEDAESVEEAADPDSDAAEDGGVPGELRGTGDADPDREAEDAGRPPPRRGGSRRGPRDPRATQ